MRRVAALAVMTLGLAVLALAVAALVWQGLSLPALSAQTEGQWAAYRLHRWAFLLGEVSLGLGIFLTGYLLWPVWALAGIMLVSAGAGALAGAGVTVVLGQILAPRSLEEAWATLREGGGRFSAWLSRTFAPRAHGEEGK